MLETELVALHPGHQFFVGAHTVVALIIPGGNERQPAARIPEQRNELAVVVQKVGGQYEVAEDQDELFGRRGAEELLLDPAANLVEPLSRVVQIDLL